MSAALTFAGAVLLALGAYAGPAVLALAVAVVQVGFVAGWFPALSLPNWHAGSALAVLAAVGASLGVLLDDVTARVAPLVAAIGLVMVAALLQELLRRDGRSHLVRSLSATVTAAAFAVLGACWVAQSESRAGETVVAAAVAAVAAAVAASAALARVRIPAVPSAAAAVTIGSLAAGVVGWTGDAVGLGAGLVIGLVSAVGAVVGEVVARFLGQELQHPETVSATSPAAAPPPSSPSPPSTDAAADSDTDAGTPVAGTPVAGTPVAGTPVAGTPLAQQAIAGSLPLLLAAPLAFVVASIVVG